MPDRWTTPNFDHLSWHDCHVHGLRLAAVQEENGTADLELDLDFIVEWLNWPSGQITFEGPAFTQVLRREPLLVDRQYLLPAERG